MATVLSIKRREISTSLSSPSSWFQYVISGLAYVVGGIGVLAISAIFIFPFVLIIGFLLKLIGL